MSYKVGKPEGINFADSENDSTNKNMWNICHGPSWGFDHNCVSEAPAELEEENEILSPEQSPSSAVPPSIGEKSNAVENGKGARPAIRFKVHPKRQDEVDILKNLTVTVYKNGDSHFKGFVLKFRPGKDYKDLDGLIQRISLKVNFLTPVTHLFDTEGKTITKMEDLKDKQSYVASITKKFVPANYGQLGDKFFKDKIQPGKIGLSKKKTDGGSSEDKPGSADGKIIKIASSDEECPVTKKVILNMKTAQSFEAVIKDLGQMLKIKGADMMYTNDGFEVKSFSQLRSELFEQDTFVISKGPVKQFQSRTTTGSQENRDLGLGEIDETGNIKILINGLKKTYYAPKSAVRNNHAPNCRLALEWVYGYRGADRANNLKVLKKGQLVYYVGAVAIVYDRAEEQQQYYQGHTEDITCMDMHPGGVLVVTGQMAGKDGAKESGAHMRVWNTTNMETRSVLWLGEAQVSVLGISFSTLNNGRYLAAVDASKERFLSIWDWALNEQLDKIDTNAVCVSGVRFHPFDSNILVTHGAGGHLAFWNRTKFGSFARNDVGEPELNLIYTCTIFLDSGDLVAGDSYGYISTFTVSKDGEYMKGVRVEAHSRGVSTFLDMGDGTVLSAGAMDHRLVSWTSSLDFAFNAETELPSSAGCAMVIHAQWPGKGDDNIYVGTSSNLILEGSLQRKFNMVVFGHISQINALATHPSDVSFVTAAADKLVAMWRRSKLMWKLVLQTEPASICYHPKGSVVGVGTVDGHMITVNADNGTHLTTTKVCNTPISAIKFSPDGTLVATASTNGSTYVNKISGEGNDYNVLGRMSGIFPLAELDWDSEGEFIQTSSTDFKLQFWDADKYKGVKQPASLRAKEWADSTCVVGWAVSGMWGNNNYPNPGPAAISAAHVSLQAKQLTAGDTDGCLRLFPHPCSSPKAGFQQIKIVSGPIHNTRFACDDSYILATGCIEAAIFKIKFLK